MPAGRLTDIFPAPQAVTLGGREFIAREATLSDLAALQAWIDTHAADPIDEVEASFDNPELTEAQRDRVLFDASELIEADFPSWHDEDGAALLTTTEGIVTFVLVALRRHNPGLTDADVLAACSDMTAAEFNKLRRVFYGVKSIDAVTRLIFRGIPQERPTGPQLLWSEAIDRVAESHRWTYEYVYSLTLSEFRNARTGGKPDRAGEVRVPLDLLEEAAAEIRRRRKAAGLDAA